MTNAPQDSRTFIAEMVEGIARQLGGTCTTLEMYDKRYPEGQRIIIGKEGHLLPNGYTTHNDTEFRYCFEFDANTNPYVRRFLFNLLTTSATEKNSDPLVPKFIKKDSNPYNGTVHHTLYFGINGEKNIPSLHQKLIDCNGSLENHYNSLKKLFESAKMIDANIPGMVSIDFGLQANINPQTQQPEYTPKVTLTTENPAINRGLLGELRALKERGIHVEFDGSKTTFAASTNEAANWLLNNVKETSNSMKPTVGIPVPIPPH